MNLPGAPHSSLRRTLLAWLILPLLLLVPLAAAVLYGLAVRPALDGLDRALTGTAVALTGILEVHAGVAMLPLSEQTMHALRADLVDEVTFAVGDARGDLLGGDAALLALKPAAMAGGQWRFFDAELRGRTMRVAAFGAACGVPSAVCPILVAESLVKRHEAERSIGMASLAAALLLAASLAVLALLAVRRGLRPLLRAAALMQSRSLQRLEPLPLSSVPREAAPFVLALNDLFARLQVAASAQRAFVEDAAHQLRTPLSTLRVEASQALAQPHPPALRPTLERLQAAAERAAHLAQQLLTLARAEGATLGAEASHRRVDLASLASAAADEWLHPALAAGQDLGFELQPAAVHGDALLLREMLDNLVHNAILHAGPGAHVTVRTRSAAGQAVLEVEDDGQGMPAAELETVWQRFHRGSGATGLGSGLGLAIVRDIARLHRGEARLQAGAGGRGIVARVSLPGAEAVAKLS